MLVLSLALGPSVARLYRALSRDRSLGRWFVCALCVLCVCSVCALFQVLEAWKLEFVTVSGFGGLEA